MCFFSQSSYLRIEFADFEVRSCPLDPSLSAVRFVKGGYEFVGVEWSQVGDKPMEAKLLSKKTQKPDTEAKNWHDKAFRLVVTEVLGQGEKPAAGEPQPLLKIEYSDHGKPRGWLEIARAPVAAPANTSMPAQNGDLYARSERTAGWMKLAANAEDVVKEADKVAGAAE